MVWVEISANVFFFLNNVNEVCHILKTMDRIVGSKHLRAVANN